MKVVTMGRACGNGAHVGAKRNAFRDLVEKKLGEREHMEEQGINRKYYKMNLEKI
jgi:hypothetical protein